MAKDYEVNVIINGEDKASGKFSGFGNAFARELGIASAAATAAALVFKGLTIAADFEAQMSAVEAVASATRPEMEALRQKAIQLGADTSFSASQVAQGMEELAKAGMKPGEVLSGIGPMLSLAAAGGLDLSDAAGIAAAALQTFNLPAEETGRVADVLAAAANNSTTSVQGVGEALKYAGGPAAALGLSLEDTAAAIGIFANRGIDASMAGTTLNAMLMALINPGDQAKKVLDDLGITTADASGKFLPFKDIIAQFPPELLSTQEGMAKINTIFGERGQRGMIALLQEGTQGFVDFKTALENSKGAADDMANIRMNNLKGAVEQVKGALESLAITLFSSEERSVSNALAQVASEFIVPVVNGFADLLGKSNPLGESISFLAHEFLSMVDFGTSLVASLGVATWAVGQFLSGIGTAIIQAGRALWEPIKAPFLAFTSTMESVFVGAFNPIIGFLVQTANTMFSPIRGALGKLGIDIGEFKWDPITVDPPKSLDEAWGTAIGNMKSGLSNAKDTMSGTFGNLKTDAVTIFDEMKSSFDGDMSGDNGIAKTMEKAAADAVKAADNEKPNMEKALSDPAKAAIKKLGEIPPAAKGVMGEAAVGVLFTGGQMTKAFGDHVDVMKAEIGTLPSDVDLALIGAGTKITENDLGGQFCQNMNDGWDDYIKGLPDWEQSVVSGFTDIGYAMDRTLSSSIADMIKTGKADFSKGMSDIGDAGAQAIGAALSAAVMSNLVAPGIQAIQSKFSEAFSGISSTAGSIIGGVAGSMVGAGIIAAGGAIINEITDAFTPDYEARRKDRERSNAATTGYYTMEGIASELTGSEWSFGREELYQLANQMNSLTSQPGVYGVGETVTGQDGRRYTVTSISGDANDVYVTDGSQTYKIGYGSWKKQFGTDLDNALMDQYADLYGKWYDLEQAAAAGAGYKALQELYKDNPNILNDLFGQSTTFEELEKYGRNSEYYKNIMPSMKFHSGGLIPGEGYFLGMAGEGVLSREAMGNIGLEGLSRLNQGGGVGGPVQITFEIYAWDGEDVEAVIRKKIIPQLREMSEAGEVVIHENGVEHAVA
jgi:TP901 family phage tail tape measure protein